MQVKKTERGFSYAEFKDRNGVQCSLQKSSLATDDAIWFGVQDADPKVLVPGAGWQPVAFPPDTLFNTRMHLTAKQVKRLLPYLKFFAKTGRLPEEHELKKKKKKHCNYIYQPESPL